MGSFEIYANLGCPQGKVSIVHLFSKKNTGMWPNFTAAANRALKAMSDSEQGADLQELEQKYTTRVSMARASIVAPTSVTTRPGNFRSASVTHLGRNDPANASPTMGKRSGSVDLIYNKQDKTRSPNHRRGNSLTIREVTIQEEKKKQAAPKFDIKKV